MKSVQLDIGNQVKKFLDGVIHHLNPDWIITVERKGTALLRAFIEETRNENHSCVNWENVISSDILRNFPDTELKGKTILVLEDAIYKGRSIKKPLEILQRKIRSDGSISTAAFLVYRGCPVEFRPKFYWYSQLDDIHYTDLRHRLIRYLQTQGSLLLDTEHIEVPVELHCPRKEFVEALRYAGDVVEFLSEGGYLNLTLYNPVIPDEEGFLERLPSEILVEGSVRKVRVIEKGRNRYSLIPIFYPSIPEILQEGWNRGLPPCLRFRDGDPETNFHAVGLFAGIQLLQGVFTALRGPVNEGKITPYMPQIGEPDDTLSHLKAVFHKLDIHELYEVITTAIDEGRAHKPKKGELKRRSYIVDGRDVDLSDTGWDVLCRISEVKENSPDESSGASYAEVTEATELKTKAALSASLDREIDGARVIPDDVPTKFFDGITRHMRIFKIDNEEVEEKVRKVKAMRTLNPEKFPEHFVGSCYLFSLALRNRFEKQKDAAATKGRKLKGLFDQDADKTIRFMNKIWKQLRLEGKNLIFLPVDDDEDKHGFRPVLATREKPPILKAIKTLDEVSNPENPQYFISHKEKGKRYEIIEPVTNEPIIRKAINDKLITDEDANFAGSIGNILGLLDQNEVISLGRHEKPKSTQNAIVWELKRWKMWVDDLLEELNEASEERDGKSESKMSECAFQIWTFGEEGVKKVSRDRDFFVEGRERIKDYSPENEQDILVQKVILKIQPLGGIVWNNSGVENLSFPAHMCFSFTKYLVGTLENVGLLSALPEKMCISKDDTLTAYKETRCFLSVEYKQRPAEFSAEWLRDKVSRGYYNTKMDIPDPNDVWGKKLTLSNFGSDIREVAKYIDERYIEPEIIKCHNYGDRNLESGEGQLPLNLK